MSAPEGRDEGAATGCAHDHIVHYSRSLTYCKLCNVRMRRDRGDWAPGTELVDAKALREKKEKNS